MACHEKERPPAASVSCPEKARRKQRKATNQCLPPYHASGALLARTWTVDPAGVVVALTTRRAA